MCLHMLRHLPWKSEVEKGEWSHQAGGSDRTTRQAREGHREVGEPDKDGAV